MHTHEVRYRLLDTPTGLFALMVREDGSLVTTWIDTSSAVDLESMKHDASMLEGLAGRLMRYFQGENVSFDDVPVPPGTAFRQRCWEACRRIPRGQTLSYSAVAASAGGGPGAARAAGQAMRHNPLPIIIPCHRVIASDGTLGGFSGSSDMNGTSLQQKKYLLELEQNVASAMRHVDQVATTSRS